MDRASIVSGLSAVEAEIQAACRKSGRPRDEVTLVAISKTFPSEAVEFAIEAGVTDVGENRVQEARSKCALVQGTARWHLVGHLQTNKASQAVRIFDVIHSIDSVELAGRLAREAEKEGKFLEVLVQVNVSGERQKSGLAPRDAAQICREVATMKPLLLTGLMTIPPFVPAEEARRYFQTLRQTRDSIRDSVDAGPLRELSMGMSGDFAVAIEEGATMIRVGRAIFGERATT